MTENTLKTGVKAGKSNKSLIERQRRAKINQRLDEIKDLILSFMYQDDPQLYTEKSCVRMDKAEILDFAVDFIKNQKHMQNAQYKQSKQFPMTRPLPWQHLTLQNTLPLPGSKLPFLPRAIPVPFISENIYPTNNFMSAYYGVTEQKLSPVEVGQKGVIPSMKGASEAVWRPWN